nr:ribonuclease H-like domain-containing protein [Tanacetum cinerariifolium]
MNYNQGNDTHDLLVRLLGLLMAKGTNYVAPSTTNHHGISNSPLAYHTDVSSPSFPSAGPIGLGPSYQPVSRVHPVSYEQVPPNFSYPTAPVGCFQSFSQAQPLFQPTSHSGQPSVQTSTMGPTGIPGQETTLPHAFSSVTLHDPVVGAWNMDKGASSHLNNSVTSFSTVFKTYMYPSISVGDGHSIPVTNTGHSILPIPFKSLHLNNVLITPHIVKFLIYVPDNNCTIEFDTFGFSVKFFMTRRVLLRCDSMGDLYPVMEPSSIPHVFLVSQHTWHQRLGHLGREVLRHLVSNNFISCNKEKPLVLCHACRLGKHVRLPFVSSNTVFTSCFEIIHSDVWTSPIPSLSGFKYYILFLDHYSQFVWVYPLLNKYDVWSKFVLFRTYVRTQFKCEIRSFQYDHCYA